MVKKTGKKDFNKGLNSIIQSTVLSNETEDVIEEIEVTEEAIDEIKPEKLKQTQKMVEKEKQITITIPVAFKKEIKKYCAINDITIKEVVINSVSKYMRIDGYQKHEN